MGIDRVFWRKLLRLNPLYGSGVGLFSSCVKKKRVRTTQLSSCFSLRFLRVNWEFVERKTKTAKIVAAFFFLLQKKKGSYLQLFLIEMKGRACESGAFEKWKKGDVKNLYFSLCVCVCVNMIKRKRNIKKKKREIEIRMCLWFFWHAMCKGRKRRISYFGICMYAYVHRSIYTRTAMMVSALNCKTASYTFWRGCTENTQT